jgi:hypothetical protein
MIGFGWLGLVLAGNSRH